MNDKTPTIKDVAKEAGVSIGTVSRVLNKRGYLSEEIIKKVHTAVDKVGYVPNDIARSLQNQKTNFIGLIVPSISHPFFAELIHWTESYAHSKNYKLLLCNSLGDEKKEEEYIWMLKKSQVAGIIMGSHVLNLDMYQNLNLPIVSLDRVLGDTIPYICSDNYMGGVLATEALIKRGAKNLIHFSGDLSLDMLSNQRTQAFIDTCKKNNITYQVYELPNFRDNGLEGGEEIFEIFSHDSIYDGVFSSSDTTAFLVQNVAAELGIRIPDELQIVGYDDIVFSRYLRPSLSSIRQPIKEIAYYAIDILHRELIGAEVPIKTVLPVELIERESLRSQI